jgi:hypothetical protein
MKMLVNGRSFTLVADPGFDAITEDFFEVRGDEIVELRLTELDEDGPAGRFRWRVVDDELILQKATYRVGDPNIKGEARQEAYWTDYDELARFNSAGATLDLDQDNQISVLEEILESLKLQRELVMSVLR